METLKLVQIVCRHGLRPTSHLTKTYPNDVNLEDLCQLGVNQLTKQGRVQMYELGRYLRERYDFFLKDDIRSVYARSSDFDRCIESANCVLTGMFPPTDISHQIDPEINWQPIAVHSESFQNDKTLMNLDMGERLRLLFTSEIFPDILESSQKIEEASKMPMETMGILAPLCDLALLEVESGMSVPPKVFTVMPEVKNVLRSSLEFLTEGKHAERFAGGLLKCLTENISTRINNEVSKEKSPKTFLYLTSDFLVFSLRKLLGIESEFINFGSTIIFELHEVDKKHIVRIFTNNDTANHVSRFKSQTIPESDYDCPVEQFHKRAKLYL